jgi:NAD-dependent dihydropyrimidine dehydrogenase PreA subunit
MERNQVQAKAIQVNQELCAGCGSCIDACSAGAIHLVDHVAEIDVDLCTACEACLENCPNGAIIAITSPSDCAPITIQPSSDPGLNQGQQRIVLPEKAVPNRGLRPLAGAALAFLGNEVAPRLVDVLIKSIENRLAQPTATSISRSIPSSQEYGLQYGGQRKQIRYRGGQMGNKKYKGRR